MSVYCIEESAFERDCIPIGPIEFELNRSVVNGAPPLLPLSSLLLLCFDKTFAMAFAPSSPIPLNVKCKVDNVTLTKRALASSIAPIGPIALELKCKDVMV